MYIDPFLSFVMSIFINRNVSPIYELQISFALVLFVYFAMFIHFIITGIHYIISNSDYVVILIKWLLHIFILSLLSASMLSIIIIFNNKLVFYTLLNICAITCVFSFYIIPIIVILFIIFGKKKEIIDNSILDKLKK